MEKNINLNDSVYQLTQQYPEIIDIMSSLGFTEIGKKAVRLSVGKIMTLPKGAAMKGIDIEKIVKALKDNGFTIVDGDGQNDGRTDERTEQVAQSFQGSSSFRPALSSQIKDYLRRLNSGEAMEAVREDFVKQFKDVKATEIMKAEQELISEGEPVSKIKQLCDIHSALFHGTQEGGSHGNTAHTLRHAPLQGDAVVHDFHHGLRHDQERMMIGQANENRDKTTALRAIAGHPLQTLYRENEAIVSILDVIDAKIASGEDATEALAKARGLAVHYAKKGDLIYPVLNVKYGIYGPSKVMWTLDDEIRAELSTLVRQTETEQTEEWKERVATVAKRAREMTFKENRILFPVCAAHLTEDDWKQMYADSKSYETCLGVEPERWGDGENWLRQLQSPQALRDDAHNEGSIHMPGGSLSVEQLTAMLDTLPMEITFVDVDNINRYFSQPFSAKAFKRPLSALGREVFTCHPPKIEPMVRAIIQDFRDGKRDKVPVWLEKNGRPMLITYMAVRDSNGKYLGTMETVQDMGQMQAHFAGNGK